MNLTDELSRLREAHKRFIRNSYHAYLGELIEQEGEDRALEIYADMLTDKALLYQGTASGGLSPSNIADSWTHEQEKALLSEVRRPYRLPQLLRDAAHAHAATKTEAAK